MKNRYSISEMKEIIRPTLHWEVRRLSREIYLLKLEFVKIFEKSPLFIVVKYLEKYLRR